MFFVAVAMLLMKLASAYDLIARLDYGTFQGTVSAEYNVSYWQRIPYAAPPVGVNRCTSLGSFAFVFTTVTDNQPCRTSGFAPLSHPPP